MAFDRLPWKDVHFHSTLAVASMVLLSGVPGQCTTPTAFPTILCHLNFYVFLCGCCCHSSGVCNLCLTGDYLEMLCRFHSTRPLAHLCGLVGSRLQVIRICPQGWCIDDRFSLSMCALLDVPCLSASCFMSAVRCISALQRLLHVLRAVC